jgi:hypothetical protein
VCGSGGLASSSSLLIRRQSMPAFRPRFHLTPCSKFRGHLKRPGMCKRQRMRFSPISGGLPDRPAATSFRVTAVELPRASQYSALSGTTRSTRTSGSVGPLGHHACASLVHNSPALALSCMISAQPVRLRKAFEPVSANARQTLGERRSYR